MPPESFGEGGEILIGKSQKNGFAWAQKRGGGGFNEGGFLYEMGGEKKVKGGGDEQERGKCRTSANMTSIAQGERLQTQKRHIGEKTPKKGKKPDPKEMYRTLRKKHITQQQKREKKVLNFGERKGKKFRGRGI